MYPNAGLYHNDSPSSLKKPSRLSFQNNHQGLYAIDSQSQSDADQLEAALKASLENEAENSTRLENLQRDPGDSAGLRNIGNVCYFNSVIQAIFQIQEFRYNLMNIYYPKDIEESLDRINISDDKRRAQRITNLELVTALRDLFVHMQFGNKNVLNPSKVLDYVVDSQGDRLILGEELDIAEFLNNFLGQIEEGSLLSSQLAQLDNVHLDERNMLFSNIFSGKFRESTIFPQEEINHKELHMGPISLNIDKEGFEASFEKEMNFVVEKTTLEGKTIRGSQILRITELPKVMVFMPRRAVYDREKGVVKVNDAFDIPEELVLNRFMVNTPERKQNHYESSRHTKSSDRGPSFMSDAEHNSYPSRNTTTSFTNNTNREANSMRTDQTKTRVKKVKYVLQSIIIHEGDANYGHYYTLVYDETRRIWIKYNDSVVTEVATEAALALARGGEDPRFSSGTYSNPCAYCLFYVKSGSRSALSRFTNNLPSFGLQKQSLSSYQSFISQDLGLYDVASSDKIQQILQEYNRTMEKTCKEAIQFSVTSSIVENGYEVPKIPNFVSYLLLDSEIYQEAVHWFVLDTILKNHGMSYRNVDPKNIDSDCRDLQKVLLDPLLRYNLTSPQCFENSQWLIIQKRAQYDQLYQCMVTTLTLLELSSTGRWIEVLNQIVTLHGLLSQIKGQTPVYVRLESFYRHISGVMFLKICDVISEDWTNASYDKALQILGRLSESFKAVQNDKTLELNALIHSRIVSKLKLIYTFKGKKPASETQLTQFDKYVKQVSDARRSKDDLILVQEDFTIKEKANNDKYSSKSPNFELLTSMESLDQDYRKLRQAYNQWKGNMQLYIHVEEASLRQDRHLKSKSKRKNDEWLCPWSCCSIM